MVKTISVPLLASHHQAQTFYQRQANPHKAKQISKQIYLNTLAVEAVHIYLSWLGIASDLPANQRVCLRAWLEGTITGGWQSVEALLGPPPEFSFRSLKLSDFNDVTRVAERGKILELSRSPLRWRSTGLVW